MRKILVITLFISLCSVPLIAQTNVAPQGTIIASVTSPTGTGSRSFEVIRDGVKPPPGSSNSSQQYDSFVGIHPAGTEYYGYTFTNPQTFSKLVFQEGIYFHDGGWWANGSLKVQVRQSNIWRDVSASPIPAYPTGDSQAAFGLSYETYTFNLNNVTGDGIRIIGTDGGSAHFVSIGELEVWASGGGPTPSANPNLRITKACLVGLYNHWTDCDSGQVFESADLKPGVGTLIVTGGSKAVEVALARGGGGYIVEVVLSSGVKLRVAICGPDAQNIRLLDDGERMGWRIEGKRLILP